MYNREKILSLLQQVTMLEQSAVAVEQANKLLLKHIHPAHKESARNLLHYLAIRAQDLRSLQKDLSDLAISSHAHAEAYTLENLKKIRYLLAALAGVQSVDTDYSTINCEESTKLLNNNSAALFGKAAFSGQTKIMVTLPTEAGDDYNIMQSLVRAGMNIARINTAHDNPDIWAQMIANIKKAARAADKHIKLYMDLEGPKIRTGKIKAQLHDMDAGKTKIPSLLLYKGSKLILTKNNIEGTGGIQPIISVTAAEIFGHIKCNESVWFDDGKLGGIVSAVDDEHIVVEITQAPDDGFKLKAEKGINFPESNLDIPSLTRDDLEHLKFIAGHADMVGYSFVQHPEDIMQLQKHLKQLKREDMGIILKIETHKAFDNLPALLFAAMQSEHCGIMIARGDLALEIGYLRMAEVQEEILWLADAAHLPVIWATQVLETQIKKGLATRAEISDVVKAVNAECVMLNKGPHIAEAIETVKDIDKRMAAHEDKKRKTLRLLHIAKTFVEM